MRLIAYKTVPSEGFSLAAAPHRRDWMDATYDRSAYRCLPMLLANQAGWMILNPATVRVKWTGGDKLNDVELERWQPGMSPGAEWPSAVPDYVWPGSHFGSGIITWTIPYLFRTPAGYNLLVRGPVNGIKDGAAPLEGLVETDWTPATWTMNWKITRRDTWITFDKGEPICMIVPQRRHELEEFTPEILSISDDAELQTANTRWCESRDQFNAAFKAGSAAGWERHYFQGKAPDGSQASEHQTKLRLKEFTRASTE